jgi:hypothetical protein
MGKTEAAIAQMVTTLRTGRGVTLYAGPTTILLDEVHARILNQLGADHPKLFLLHSDNDESTIEALTLSEQVQHMLDGHKNSTIQPVEYGTVIIITHKTFIELNRMIRNKSKVTVFFDEAYRCVMDPVNVELTKKEAQMFRDNIRLEFNRTNEYVRVLHVRNEQAIQNILNRLNGRKTSSALFQLLDSVRRDVSEAYLYITGEDENRFEFQEVKVPTRIFEGWSSVYLMSAYLRNTQLWALMLRGYFAIDGEVHGMYQYANGTWEMKKTLRKMTEQSTLVRVIIKDVTAAFIPDYKKRLKAFENRYRSATILSLTNGKMLSRNLLNSILVAEEGYEEKQEELKNLLQSLRDRDGRILVGQKNFRLSRKELMTYAAAPEGRFKIDETTMKFVDWYRSFNVVERRPYKWFLRNAISYGNRWMKKRDCLVLESMAMIGGKLRPQYIEQKPLVLLNNAERDRVSRAGGNPKITLLPFECAGINEYRDHQVVAFLAALNASPAQSRFYTDVIPWYDSKKDYAVASAVQAITRGALRKHESNDPVLIIVADQEMAELLKQRLLGAPTIVNASDYGCESVLPLEFSLKADAQMVRLKRMTGNPMVREKRKKTNARSTDKNKEINATVRAESPYRAPIKAVERKLARARLNLDNKVLTQEHKGQLSSMSESLASLRKQQNEWARARRAELRKELK